MEDAMNALAFAAMRPDRGVLPTAKGPDTIEARRLVMRRPAEGDVVAITALADNVSVAGKLPDMPHPYTIADASRFIRRQRDPRSGLTGFAIIVRDGGAVIGCGKLQSSGTEGESRIGLWIGEPHWNRGYATEAAQALVDHAFSQSPRLISLRASIRTNHCAARRLLEKCGFQYAGPGAEMDIRMGSLVPIDHYQIDRGIWASIKTWSQTSARHLPG
jgi:RimJ/RimL family protein N-acetyltransferase